MAIERRPMTKLERGQVRRLAKCRLPSFGFPRRLVTELASRLGQRPALVSEREAAWLSWLCWRFRRQLPAPWAPKVEPTKPPPAPRGGKLEGEPRFRPPSRKAQVLQEKLARAMRGEW